MMNRQTLFIFLTSIAAAGCASSRSKELDKKLTEAPPVASRQQLQEETDLDIAQDSKLTPDQKARLGALRASTTSQIDDLNGQSLKLRAVLVEELLSPNYSIDEVDLIKSRLKKIEGKRLSLMFDSVDQASTILGRQANQHRAMMKKLLEDGSVHGHEKE